MVGVHLAVSLVNLESSGSWGSEALERALQEHAIRRSRVTGSAGEEIRAWSRLLQPVFEASSQGQRCEKINALLADGAGSVYLTTHDGLRPHLHFAPDAQDVQSRVKAVTAGALAIFTMEAEGNGWVSARWTPAGPPSSTPAAAVAAPTAARAAPTPMRSAATA